jgi:DNA-binding YbaB/EbfC family protein
MGNLSNLMSQLGQMQANLRQAQEAAASEVVEGSAGGGAVKIQVSGDLQFRQVLIDPKVVDPADVEMLQDLVLAAVRDAVEQAQAATAQALSGGIDLEGLGLGGLLGGGEPSSE